MNVNDKVALVTGGARGIGRSVAIQLAKRGTKVVVNYLSNQSAAEEVVQQIEARGGEAVAIQGDVRVKEQIQELLSKVKEKFGTINILVCNANMNFAYKPFAEMTWEEFSQKLNDELQAAFVTTQAVLPQMVEERSGRVTYISSTLGKDPSPHMIAHGTAKGGLDTFALYIAQEFGQYNITTNVVAPGLVMTDSTAGMTEGEKSMISNFTPLGRLAEPDDVAGVVSFLASNDAKFVTGTYTPVTGGLVME